MSEMKREFLVDMSMIEVQRYLRQINAHLIRCIPKWTSDRKQAYIVLYTNAVV